MPVHLMDIPRELLLCVFESQSSIADVLFLSACCRSTRELFLANVNIIVDRVLRRDTLCFEDLTTVTQEMAIVNALRPSTVAAPVSSPTSLVNSKLADLRRKCRLINQATVAVDAVAIAWQSVGRPRSTMACPCPTHPCYQHVPGWSVIRERTLLTHGFYFVKLCVMAYFSASLCVRCQRTLYGLPCAEYWAVTATGNNLVGWNRLSFAQAVVLGMFYRHDTGAEDRMMHWGVDEEAEEPWKKAWEISDMEPPGWIKEESEEAYDHLLSQKAEACKCDGDGFLPGSGCTGEWVSFFRELEVVAEDGLGESDYVQRATREKLAKESERPPRYGFASSGLFDLVL